MIFFLCHLSIFHLHNKIFLLINAQYRKVNPLKIPAELKQKVSSIPELPGIYKMLDSRGNIIYIGKSKCLKKRVRTYFTGNHRDSKTEKLISLIDNIEYIVTDTHLEARLLECRLIKEIRPLFNSQMKNDGKYVYLKVAEKYNPYRALTVETQRSEHSYGPFRQKHLLFEITDSLASLFPVTKREDRYVFDYNSIPSAMDKTDFNNTRMVLIELFSDIRYMNSFIEVLEKKMNESALSYRFETASRYRDIIKGLNHISYRINDYKNFLSRDYLLKIPVTEGTRLFYISCGRIVSAKTVKSLTAKEMDSFIDTCKAIKPSGTIDANEKSAIDFHDIIYSEIMTLPKEWYVRL